MACDLKPSIERMRAKLHDIEELAFFAQADADVNDKLGGKYMVLSRAIGKIAEKVRDTMTVREYWYAKFVEEGDLRSWGKGMKRSDFYAMLKFKAEAGIVPLVEWVRQLAEEYVIKGDVRHAD